MKLPPPDRYQIVARAHIHPVTVQKAYADPSSVRPSCLRRIEEAAKALGLPLPGGGVVAAVES